MTAYARVRRIALMLLLGGASIMSGEVIDVAGNGFTFRFP